MSEFLTKTQEVTTIWKMSGCLTKTREVTTIYKMSGFLIKTQEVTTISKLSGFWTNREVTTISRSDNCPGRILHGPGLSCQLVRRYYLTV